jgi:hypothetical protein
MSAQNINANQTANGSKEDSRKDSPSPISGGGILPLKLPYYTL